MNKHFLLHLALITTAIAQQPAPQPEYPRPLRDLNKSYFPFQAEGLALPDGWKARAEDIRERILQDSAQPRDPWSSRARYVCGGPSVF
jgi:hypothetical protein